MVLLSSMLIQVRLLSKESLSTCLSGCVCESVPRLRLMTRGSIDPGRLPTSQAAI